MSRYTPMLPYTPFRLNERGAKPSEWTKKQIRRVSSTIDYLGAAGSAYALI